MGWNEVEAKGQSGQSGAGFLTLKDGDVKKVHIIDDEPFTFRSIFFKSVNKSVQVDENANPLKNMKGFDAKKRHAINVYDYDDGKIKVFAGSNATFNKLKGIHEEWGGFSNVDFKISRTGSSMQDTDYQIVPTPKCQWNDGLIEGQEIFDLTQIFAITPDEIVMAYAEGRDPQVEFDPEKLEIESDQAVETEGAPLVEEGIVEEPEPVAPKKQTIPIKQSPKPIQQPKPTQQIKPLSRTDLVVKLNAIAKTKARYKKAGQWLADVKKFGGADKSSMSQCSQEQLAKLYAFVQTVK